MKRLLLGLLVAIAAMMLALGALLFTFVFFIRTGDPMILVFGVLSVLMTGNLVLIVTAVAHALLRDDLTSEQRIIWTIISVFVTPILAVGAILYLVLGRARTAGLFRDVRFGRGGAPPRA